MSRYKLTEVGVIPEDWEVNSLVSLSEKIMVGIASAATHAYRDKGIALLRNQNIKVGFLDDSDVLYVDPAYESVFRNKRLKSGDLLTARTGYPGTTCVVPEKYESAQSFTTLITRPNAKAVDSLYLCYYINSEYGQRFFEQSKIGGAQKNVNAGSLKTMPVPLPTISEQRAIATALFDVDAMIGSLDRLTAKKRDMKQATMQELLTGKRRLPGFTTCNHLIQTNFGVLPEDWVVKPLKQISTMNGRIGWQGLKQEEFSFNGDDPFLITGMNFKDGDIRWNEVYHITENRYEEAIPIQLRNGDILMTKDGTIGKMLYVSHIPSPSKASLNSHLLVFRPICNSYDPKFMFYQLCSRRFTDFIDLNKSGTTFFGITQESVGNYPTCLPAFEEQRAIATILSDMDADINIMEQKLDKTRMMKQGMMQELLTGRIRLYDD